MCLIAPVERKTTDFLAGEQHFKLMLKMMKSRHSQRFLNEKEAYIRFGCRSFLPVLFLFYLRTKLLSDDLDVFWCVRLPSRGAKSMLNVATVFDRMSARGAHLILGARGEALIRKRHSLNIVQKT